MADSNTYSTATEELAKLFEAAAVPERSALGELAEILKLAEPRQCSVWDEGVRLKWEGGLQKFAEKASLKTLDEAEFNLADAMMEAGLDGAIFRNLYAALIKQKFPNWENPDGLVDCLWLHKEKEELEKIRKRLDVLRVLKKGAFCYTPAFGVGTVDMIDEISGEVRVAFVRRQATGKKADGLKPERQMLGLRNFLDNLMVIDIDSDLHNWMAKKSRPEKMDLKSLTEYMNSHITSARPALLNPGRALLVPGVMTEAQFKVLTSGVPAKQGGDAQAGGTVNTMSWDQSRSLLELNERLKLISNIDEASKPDIANVTSIFEYAAPRDDMVLLFATALASLEHMLPASMKPEFDKTVAMLSEKKAVVWENEELFIEASDKLAGKLVIPWFAVTKRAKGADYLIARTLKLPYRLWAGTEKNLTAEERSHLAEAVEAAIEGGDVTADTLFWLWKSDYEDLKMRYLTKSVLLFRTLQKDVKGNYLKAHRDLFKLMMNEEPFQRLIMNYGDEETVTEFVHCIKRMPLLEAGDRQSLEVKIIRLYPEFKHLVEERKAIHQRAALPRVTSWRSLKLREMQLKNLVEEQIPANADALEHARSLGDLRENSEYKFAKEQQSLLGKMRREYESSLVDLRGTDFHDVEVTDTVVLGCAVTVKFSGGRTETYYVLGLLDTVPKRNMISFETPLGKLLIGRKLDERLEMPSGEHGQIIEITALPKEMIDWFNEEPVLGEE